MNTQRRYRDNNGNQFIPMNVEGQDFNDNFMKPYKLIVLTCMLLGAFVLGGYLSSIYATVKGYVIYYIIYAIICSFIIRFVIFEEKYYFALYKERQGKEVTTPATFWKVASIKDTADGAIITYADLKVGVVIKLDRGSITGRDAEFRERHFDSISNFYKEIMLKKYKFAYINSMEPSGKDPRLAELDKIVAQAKNPNINKLLGYQVGHIKRIAQNSSYETEYYLIYSESISRADSIISDCLDIAMNILDGAYINFSFLNKKELTDLDKEKFGVKYFNSTEASLNIYKVGDYDSIQKPFNIESIEWSDGYNQKLSQGKINKMHQLINNILAYDESNSNISFKRELYERVEEIQENKIRESIGIDFNKLGQNNTGRKTILKPVRPKQNTQRQQIQQEDKQQVTDNQIINSAENKKQVTLQKNTEQTTKNKIEFTKQPSNNQLQQHKVDFDLDDEDDDKIYL